MKTKQSVNITDSRPLSMKSKIGITLLLLVFIGIGCVPLYMGIQGVREVRASSSWPQAIGKITQSRIEHTTSQTRDKDNHERTTHSYSANVQYEFEVNGVTHRGTRVTVVNDQFGSESNASAIVEKYPHDAEVSVFYKPEDPTECVLEPGSWGGTGFLFLFASGFILIPLGFLRVLWQPNVLDKTDPQWRTAEKRKRFGLTFRERFIEWQPGQMIHLHRDQLGVFNVIGGAVIAGLLLGLIFGLIPAFVFFEDRGGAFLFQCYLVASAALTVVGGIGLGWESRRRDSVIDWGRGNFHAQVGWIARDFPLDQIHELTLSIEKPKPRPSDPDVSDDPTRTYAARINVHVGRKTFILLEAEFVRDDRNETRSKLLPVVERLAEDLQVSWSER